jgi:putative YphP/YqiW family bacilliredoxin
MPYPTELVMPMKQELTALGVKELLSATEVDLALGEKTGTTFLVINSVCGCAAGNARPAVRVALQNAVVPDRSFTVFAGQDLEATAEARTHIPGYPPSSPSMALFRDGMLVLMLERKDIEGRSAAAVAQDLIAAFDKYCVRQPS